MNTKILCTFLLCFSIFSLHAQNYYYNGDEKVTLHASNDHFISFDPLNEVEMILKGFEQSNLFPNKGFAVLKDKKANFSLDRQALDQTFPALLLEPGSSFRMYPTKTIRVKLKPGATESQLLALLPKEQLADVTSKFDILRIEVEDIRYVIKMANSIYESGLAEFSLPDFYIPIVKHQNDPLFPLQFQMHNTGQTIDGVQGVNDIDCNALQAWGVSLGDDVTVAVVDEGLENHEDLGGRLVGGFTPATNGNGTPTANNATHGMNCAGVIGASDDNLGLRGVAPNVDFLGVNIFAMGTTNGDIADGITWAVNNGADVISNSWGFNSCSFTSADINNAINNAVTNGRNGQGAVVVFSAGNSGGCVNYPANSGNVVAVGAIDNRGNLFGYSSRGAELDLVAPSGETNNLGNVRTLDRMGTAGRENGNYSPSFGGTSAACPVVAGAAALVISMNPNLTQQQVRDILTSTATDMGANGFDNDFGFGRVNAFAAVNAAFSNTQMSGTGTVCNTNTSYNLTPAPPAGTAVNWTVSTNLQIISQTNTGVTVRAINGSVQGSGFVRATVGATVITKNVWVGIPNPVTRLFHVATFGCTQGEINASIASGASQFAWTVSGGTIVIPNVNSNQYTGPSSVIFVDPVDGPYGFTVRVTAKNSCGDASQYRKDIPTNCDPGGGGGGVTPLSNSWSLNDDVLILPNPADKTVSVNLHALANNKNGEELKIYLQLFDVNGRLVLERQTNNLVEQLSVSSLENGVYILRLSNGVEHRAEKLVVQH